VPDLETPRPARTLAAMDDRHGRHRLRTADPRRRPSDGYRATGVVRFDRLVGEALRAVPGQLLEHLQRLELRIADVPPPDPFGSGDEVLLARYEAAQPASGNRRQRDQRIDRLILYRRPLEARARSKPELVELVREVVIHEIAHHLGMDDDDIEELGWG
jgi:predicted Zn-dependent protease with MMP-like domain